MFVSLDDVTGRISNVTAPALPLSFTALLENSPAFPTTTHVKDGEVGLRQM
jgi:hypothetical protein